MTLIGTSTIVFPKVDRENPSEKRKHVCNVCSRAFKRSEHRIRHQRGHTQEKPFGCRVCRRRYSRRDLLVRHERTLHTPEQLATAIANLNSSALSIPSPVDKTPSTTSASVDDDDGSGETATLQKDPFVSSSTDFSSRSGQSVGPNHNLASRSSIESKSPRSGPLLATDAPVPAKLPSSAADTSMVVNTGLDPTIILEFPTATRLYSTDFGTGVSDLDKMRTFPSSVPLPDLDGDLEFLDFFDPFLGLSPTKVDALTPAPWNEDGWSPLESFTNSDHTPIQDHGFEPSRFLHTRDTLPVANPGHPWTTATQITSQSKCEAALWEDASAQSLGVNHTGTEGRQSLQLAQTRHAKQPALVFTDSMRAHLIDDLSKRLTPEQLSDFRMPTATALQKCIRTYVDAFHVHLPIFHLQTMNFETMASPLTLAICAIGAQYRLERKVSASLYLQADRALKATVDQREHPHSKPRLLQDWVRPRAQSSKSTSDILWKSQTRLLLAMLSCFSGDTEVISEAIMHLGDFLMDFRHLAPIVKPCRNDPASMNWHEWVERESVKRVLYGQIMFGNLVTMTYGIPPGYSVSDGYIEMPCDQSLWDSLTEEQWREAARRKGQNLPLNVKDAVLMVMNEGASTSVPQECWEWSPFAISVVINIISIHIWHVTQGSYLFGGSLGSGQTEDGQKSQTLTQTEAALSRCRALITQAKSDADYPWTEAETPLLFNCLALLRVSYCRAFTGHSAGDSMMLLKDNQDEFAASIEDFVAMPQNRGNLVGRAVGRAFEGMIIPYRAGTMLIKKTAALTWAIGHALAGWEVALLVTKWVHTIEAETRSGKGSSTSELESQTMKSIRSFLSVLDDGLEAEDDCSLAAKLARYWAGFYDDTWVWGVTPRMANILRELANCYERELSIPRLE